MIIGDGILVLSKDLVNILVEAIADVLYNCN